MKKTVKTKSKNDINIRKIVAIGDLHGDYFRFLRILKEENLIIEHDEKISWNPDAENTDVVLIGDYVDWRGEELEGPKEEWLLGSEKLLKTIYSLHEQYEEKIEKNISKIKFYPLLGNHDLMMASATEILKLINIEKLQKIIELALNPYQIRDALFDEISETDSLDSILKFLNWFYQGGSETIQSFGGLIKWQEAMNSWLGKFIYEKTKFYVVINKTLFSHSIPDHPQYWIPIEELDKITDKDEFSKIRHEFVWGRRIWGYNGTTGHKTEKIQEEQIEKILNQLGVEKIVVGHTPLMSEKPYIAYNGKIINIDSHGMPDSVPYIESYNQEVNNE